MRSEDLNDHELESVLRGMQPLSICISSEQIMFQAGQAAASKHKNPGWQTATGVLLIVVMIQTYWMFTRSPNPILTNDQPIMANGDQHFSSDSLPGEKEQLSVPDAEISMVALRKSMTSNGDSPHNLNFESSRQPNDQSNSQLLRSILKTMQEPST